MPGKRKGRLPCERLPLAVRIPEDPVSAPDRVLLPSGLSWSVTGIARHWPGISVFSASHELPRRRQFPSPEGSGSGPCRQDPGWFDSSLFLEDCSSVGFDSSSDSFVCKRLKQILSVEIVAYLCIAGIQMQIAALGRVRRDHLRLVRERIFGLVRGSLR
jgi:hypothetical protein